MHRLSCSLALLLMILAPGCDNPATSADGPDGGLPPLPDSAPDQLAISWPAPSLNLDGASDPLLLRSPAGALTLLYQQDKQLWAHRAPPAGAPVQVAELNGAEVEMSAVASPLDDRIFVAWAGRYGATLTAGQPDGAPFQLYQGMPELVAIGTGWSGGPLVTAYTTDLWYGSDHYPPDLIGFRVPWDDLSLMPLPAPEGLVIEANVNSYHHYDEQHHLLDLGQDRALLFRTRWQQDPADPSGEKHMARWHHLGADPAATGTRAHYLVPRASGMIELPHWAGWIQAHQLEEGSYALSWGSSENSMVYDVYLAGLTIAQDGTPSLATDPVNVSMTRGDTQNSDHAIIRPTGDGRYWIAWRESDFGPRVALLDGQDFHVLTVAAPETELFCNMASSMGAQVDEQGTLHLAAGFDDDNLRVSLFQILLP